jgi:hypothetical protein
VIDCPQHLSIQVELGLLILCAKTIIVHSCILSKDSDQMQVKVRPVHTSQQIICVRSKVRVRVMVFNTTFNNISVFLWWSVLLVEETVVPGENHRNVTCHWQTLSHNVVSSTPCHAWVGFKLTTLVVIGCDCTGSCKSNCHMITTMMAPCVRSRHYNVGRNILVV